jgi:2-octaprenyl-6-methoxyphenol hydroxylase
MDRQAQGSDVCIAGAGVSGLVAATLLAREDFRVAVVAPAPRADEDTRTVALMQPSVRLLRYLGAWPQLSEFAEPLRSLRIVDNTGDFLRAPTITFTASEVGLDAFGWNVPLHRLEAVLREACIRLGVRSIEGMALRVEQDAARASLVLQDGTTVDCRMVIAADGADSRIRASLGLRTQTWTYDQVALATRFSHTADHGGLSTEYHRAAGPLTTVPLPGRISGLVWLERPVRARELMAMPPHRFASELQAAMHGELGAITIAAPRASIPMRGLLASRFGDRRTLLVGEAAHAVPPIGAQGLNMSLRDAATAAELIADARRSGSDPGDGSLAEDYTRMRKADVVPRQSIIDGFNRSLLSTFAPLRLARVLALSAIDRVSYLRHLAMKEGLEPSSNLPRAMR